MKYQMYTSQMTAEFSHPYPASLPSTILFTAPPRPPETENLTHLKAQ